MIKPGLMLMCIPRMSFTFRMLADIVLIKHK